MEYLLKSRENRLSTLIASVEEKHVERLNIHSKIFEYEIQKLHDVDKECHDIFIKQVTNIKESVDLQVAELKSEMAKEFERMENNYTVLHNKFDFVLDAIAKLVEFNTSYSTKLEAKSKQDSMVFAKLEEFLSSIQESISKVDLSTQSIVSQESISQLISKIETNIKTELAPILELVLHLPINTPRAMQLSQRGDKGCGGVRSSKDSEKEQWLEK